MRTTFDTRFYCRKSKANNKNQAPLELSITINGERKFINLPCKCDVDDFNKKRQTQEIKDLILEWEKKIQLSITSLLQEGMPITAESLREILRTGGTRSYTIDDCFTDYLKILHKRVGVSLTASAYRKYELTRDLFYDFTNKDAEITTVTPALIQNYYADLCQRYQPNSAASYIAKTKTILQFAIDNNKLHVNPFQGLKVKREKKPIEYLTEQEINKIATQEYSTEALKRVADVFLVQTYSGLSFVDLENLKKDDIMEDNGTYYIHKKRVKTGVEYTAVLFPKAIEILEKYDYKLPIISNQKTNSALKAIARECEIDKRLYDHLGRKSYGSMLLNRGCRLDTVAKALGHSQTKTTATYYASLHKDTVLQEIASVI